MTVLQRSLNLPNLLEKKSFFLFGPRATGKSFLIRMQFPDDVPVINLLKSDYFLRLSAHPEELESIIMAYEFHELVIIDEVQRIPLLLNEVHRLIEERKIKFLLTGSSARKLKRDHSNLLAGRAWTAELMPLTSHEIPSFDLERYLTYGGLPAVYLSEYPEEDLFAYVNTYLKEEIQAEALVRSIPAFSRFLQVSALMSGKMLNFSELASDTGVPASTVREYYHILEDTFIGFLVPAWTKTVKRKAMSTAKFYYFDLGVRNVLSQTRSIERKTDVYGQLFEHFIANELRAYISYRRKKLELRYWCSKHGAEVNFIVGDTIAIEVKSSDKITHKHLKNLRLLEEEKICTRYILISHDSINRKYENIEVMSWKDFLNKLWADKIIL